MTKTHNRLGRALGAALLAGSLGACDFIESTGTNPNAVPTATIDQLFTATQVNTFAITEGEISRLSAVWLQQMAGTDRQFSALDRYQLQEDDAGSAFTRTYTGGGLIDIRRATAAAEEAGRPAYAGILRVHEAYLIGMAASFFGDIPYSEAVNLEITTPKLDEQAAVYAAVQTLLDKAITDMGSGSGPAVDLNFAGNTAKWRAAANTLKARYYMHWVEAQRAGGSAATMAQTACAGDCVAKAIAAANNGIKSSADNWRTIHSSTATENNLWFQFNSERSGYISAGKFGVDLLVSRNDPRLPLYYSRGGGAFAGQFIGSAPGASATDPESDASQLSPTGYGSASFSMPMVSCSENYFILAEAHFYQNNAGASREALANGVACESARTGTSIPAPSATLAGPALLTEIMTQKYIALFLNPEAWNDYKRTCLPVLISTADVKTKDMPRRLFYGRSERQTNPNVPAPNDQPKANDNDPTPCG